MNAAWLFTGHMIDTPDRREPRFPQTCERRAAAAIGALIDTLPRPDLALAGAASGGDILFHEACRARGIASAIRLAKPPADFASASVAPAGGDWLARYDALLAGLPWQVLPQGPDMWERCNRWMLDEAVARVGAASTTLLALWDGRGGGGPGGTEHFLRMAGERGVGSRVIGVQQVCGFA